MREGWKKVNLDNSVVEIIDGDRGGNYPKQDEFFDKGYCLFLNTGNVTVSGFNFEKTQFVTKEKDGLLRKGKLRRNDIILTTRGTVGNVAYYDNSVPFENVRINSGMVVLRIDSEQKELYTKYFYHFLKSALFKKQVLSHASGSAQPQLPIKDMKQIELTLPPFETQRRIAAILSALDAKIELNRQTNQTLEAIAQALFKEWFVDFNFPGATGEMQDSEVGPIPVGWKVYKLEDLIDTVSITHKFDKDEVIFLNTSDIESGRVLNHNYCKAEGLPGQAKKSIHKLDILFTEIRPANKRFALIDFDADDYVVSTKLMVLRTKVDIHPIVIYNYLTSDEILNWLQHLAESRSGTFPQITFSQVKELKIALPTNDFLNAYVSIAWPAFEVVSNCDRETKALVEIRDSLLPKLMNGEIEV